MHTQIDFFGKGSGIKLPESSEVKYIIESENLLPPYTIESQVKIPLDEIMNFIKANAFTVSQNELSSDDFLRLTENLPPERKPILDEGAIYVKYGGNSADSQVPVGWTYILNRITGDLWIQYNTE